MDSFLSQYINSLGPTKSQAVVTVLQQALVGKSDLSILISQLQNVSQHTALQINEDTSQTFVSSSDFKTNIAAIDTFIQSLFAESNNISLLLNNLSQTLTAQAKSLEDQINVLETRLANYAFLAADNNSYSYGYTEHFHDNNGRDSFSSLIPDRTSTAFAVSEQALVNPLTKSLCLCSNISDPYPLTAAIINGNVTPLTVSDTGIQNAVSSLSSIGWRVEYSSAIPITSSLQGSDSSGAQVLIEFKLAQPAYASQIEIVPFSDTAMDLVQVSIFPSNDDSLFTNMLDSPINLNAPLTINIPYQSVTRFRLLINQPTYTRVTNYSNQAEQQYNTLSSQPNIKPPLLGGPTPPRRWNYSEFFNLYYKVNSAYPGGTISRPKAFDISRGLSLPQILKNTQTKLGPYESWNLATTQNAVINQLFLNQPGTYKKIFISGVATADFLNTNQAQIIPQVSDPAPVTAMLNPVPSTTASSFDYTYDLGLQYVGIGYESIGDRGVFVSKPLPAQGGVGAVRLSVSDNNVILPNADLDSDIITSTEYSVSNVSNPQLETDWTPIYPVDLTNNNSVLAERFFPDFAGRGYFRFSADRTLPIQAYKNGYAFTVTAASLLFDNSNNVVVGLTLPFGSFTTSDIFTVDYTTSSDFSVITFPNLDQLPVTSASDSQGAGEGFTGTSGRNMISLTNVPYIDTTEVNNSTYSTTTGMTPYQPIVVKFSNGSIATNLTNYTGGTQADLSNFNSGYYYIQSGTNIMFAGPITQSFRVYYQYLQSSVRFRVVERVNYTTFASPTVNSVTVKAKTIQPNPQQSLGSA